jgi:site-specific DNA recombinase
MTTAALYLRVSQAKEHDDDQSDSDSIENQRKALLRRAKKEKYDLAELEYVDDGKSGFKQVQRDGFRALLADMALGKFDIILVRHADRLERNDGDSSLIRVACAKYGVKWQTADGQITDPATASGAFNAKIMSAVAQLESQIKSERLLNFYEGAHSKGLVLPPKGTYGYDDADRSKVVPEEAARILAAYEAVDSGLTVGSIVRKWNEDKVPQRKGGMRWTYAHLNAILRRPRNAGLMARKGQILDGVVGQWETIVDPEMWHRVNKTLANESRKTSPGFQPVWLSSGTARCGVCGSPMRSNTATDARRDTRYSILRCSAAVKGERHASGRLEDYYAPKTEKTKTEPETETKNRKPTHEGLEPLVRAAVLNAFMWGGDSLLPQEKGVDVSALLAAQTALSEEKTDVMGYRRDGLLTPAEERSRLVDITERAAAVSAQLEGARARNASLHMLVDIREGLRYDGNRISIDVASELFGQLGERFDKLHIEQRRLLVDQLLEITVRPGRKEKFVIRHKVVEMLNPLEEE